MGVSVYALKIKQFICKEYDSNLDDNENARCIFSLDFKLIIHLSQFPEGYYDTQFLNAPDFDMGYGGYNHFRQKICLMVHGVTPDDIWDNIDKWLGKPFIEFINFADNEGSFDFVIAEKLYKNFSDFKEKAEKELPADLYRRYCDYMEILKVVYENKGVIYYS